jgi:hypothetical protein
MDMKNIRCKAISTGIFCQSGNFKISDINRLFLGLNEPPHTHITEYVGSKLGFHIAQLYLSSQGTKKEKNIDEPMLFVTPWNVGFSTGNQFTSRNYTKIVIGERMSINGGFLK